MNLNRKITIILFTICLSFCSIATQGQNAQIIEWKDLIPEGLDFEDPFLTLSDKQLYSLKYLYKTSKLLEKRPEMKSNLTPKIDSVTQLLEKDNIDIPYFFSLKNEIREKRKLKAESTVPELNHKKIRMAGFLLPLEYVDKTSYEFLLVPVVGACIHSPPPPKNQILYASFPEGYSVEKRYVPVWIEGELIIENYESTLRFIDGTDLINSGYTLKVTFIEPYFDDEN